jgi:hypothetical protein
MTGEPDETGRSSRPDTSGFLVLLVVAAIVGAAFIAGVRFLLRWLEEGGPPPGP